MPIFTTSVISLARTPSANVAMAASTPRTSGITSFPPTITGDFDWLRSAVCSTARPSVVLMIAPANIASRFLATSAALAKRQQQLHGLGRHRTFGKIQQQVILRRRKLSEPVTLCPQKPCACQTAQASSGAGSNP